MAQLQLNIIATNDVFSAPSAEQARKALPTLRALYDAQGLQARSSEAGFNQWLLQGGEFHAPLYAGYENQIVQQVLEAGANGATVLDNVRVLYPDPTIYSDHPILALNANAGRLIDAMKDPDVQRLAWQRFGFRSGTQVGLNNVADFANVPLAQQFRTTKPPNADVTLLLARVRQGRRQMPLTAPRRREGHDPGTRASDRLRQHGGRARDSRRPARADAALARLVSRGDPRALVCKDLLTPAQREQATHVAKQLYPAMLSNTDQLATFGGTAIEQVNAQVNRIFREVGPVDIPELTQIMREVNDRMREFRRKYDPRIPRSARRSTSSSDAIKGLFRRGRDMLEMLFEDARYVERQLDRIAGTLAEKQQHLKRNVVLCDELYRANEAAIGQLIGAIAVMELIRDAAVAEARSITIDPADPGPARPGGVPVPGHRVHPGHRGPHQRVPAAPLHRLVDLAAGAQHPHAQLRPRTAPGAAGQPDDPDDEADDRPVGPAAAGQPGGGHAAGGSRRRQRCALRVRERVRHRRSEDRQADPDPDHPTRDHP